MWSDYRLDNISNAKSMKINSKPLNDSALEILDQPKTLNPALHLFVNPRTKKRYTNINKTWRRIREAAGLPELRLHDLRHQFTSILVNNGRTLFEVQQILGHSASTVTQRYAHLSSRTLKETATSIPSQG